MNNGAFDAETILEIETIFLGLEEEYIKQLVTIPVFRELLQEYYSFSNEELMARFSKFYNKMESMEVTEGNENHVELHMIACVLAIAEKVKRLIKVKTPDLEPEEEVSHGMGR